MGFFWANVKANIEGAVANAKMHYTFEIKEYQIPINYDKI